MNIFYVWTLEGGTWAMKKEARHLVGGNCRQGNSSLHGLQMSLDEVEKGLWVGK
jgi:hypothetical protein